MAEKKENDLTKKVISLDDGRELIYYNFSNTGSQPINTKKKPKVK